MDYAQNERRRELYNLNVKAWNGEPIFSSDGKKLDSSIKKNTGFIKKLKLGIAKDSKTGLLKDIQEISLEKYLPEIVVTAHEGLTKVSGKNEDIDAAVEIISALHQRFSQRFSPALLELFLHNFSNQELETETEKEEAARVVKGKVCVRLLTELHLVGVFRCLEYTSKENLPTFISRRLGKKEPLVFTVLREVLNFKFKDGYSTTIATNFVKRFSDVILFDASSDPEPFKDEDMNKMVYRLLKVFSEAVNVRAAELNQTLNKLIKEHRKAQIRTGKTTDEFSEKASGLEPVLQRFENAALILSKTFGLDMPTLDKLLTGEQEENIPIITNQIKIASDRLWENEATKKFYEVLPNLEMASQESEGDVADAKTDSVNEFFTKLEQAETKEAIDELSLLYWTNNLDNKATRKRLLKFFIESPDWSKIRLYARFIATNAAPLAEIKEELIQHLDSGFRNQLHSNKINVKNIIYFSEMVKFSQIPPFMVFHKIRALILNINTPNNIEILTILFENFGKFLINHPMYKEQMEKMVELLQQKKKDHGLSVSNKCAIDNLVVLIYPPSLSKLNSQTKTLSAEQQFYRVLLRRELNNFQPEKVTKLVRKADWSNKEVYHTLFAIFIKPEKVSFQSMDNLAKVTGGIYPYHRNFVIKVIDAILENVLRGLEINDFSMNMKRIAHVKYLVLLYNHDLIRFEVILDTMFRILKYGYPKGSPNLGFLNEYDLPDNYFRIQLVTTMLLSIEKNTPNLKKKMHLLMRFLEYYSFVKDHPLPKETQFRLEDAFSKMAPPSAFVRSSTITESSKMLQDLLKNLGVVGMELVANADDDDADDSDAAIGDDDDAASNGKDSSNDDLSDSEQEEEQDKNNGALSEDLSDEDSTSSSSEDEDDFTKVDDYLEKWRAKEEYEAHLRSEEDRKAEEDFDRQFKLLMQESMESRKNEKISGGSIPMVSSGNNIGAMDSGVVQTAISANEDKSHKVSFTFLSKSGKKTQAKKLALPGHVKFVADVLEQGEKLKAERQKIKNIVLSQKFD
ncbi:LAMI_0C04478g1_1 [Lachancea mirantina]|uniref:LAMI_0C04478g1_1 n=1 Tax=Lachancea mirantina TaxID=1230905 RepID=A0A1G4J2E1_9SACH|nr:LAMI_0C04478g1_1 [Lachancea mirantina]